MHYDQQTDKDILIQDFEKSSNKMKAIATEYKTQIEGIRKNRDERIDAISRK